MNPIHRSAAIGDLRHHDVEPAEAPDLRTLRQILRSGQPFEMVIGDFTLPDGNWCGMLQELQDAGSDARVLVCADRHDQLLCGEIVARGGYYAVAPPHEWKPLAEWINRACRTGRRAPVHEAGPLRTQTAVA